MILERFLRARTGPVPSEAALALRRSMRLTTLISLVGLALAIGGARGRFPVGVGVAGGVIFLLAILSAAWMGVRASQQAREDREMEAGRAMIVMLAAELGKQDDATLERIATKGGPAGEAARLILQGRRDPATRASASSSQRPGGESAAGA